MTSLNGQNRTLLQWLAPELARAGLVRNEEWVPLHAEEAEGMFDSKSLAIAATVMASAAPCAIDYLRQAPILATLLAGGNDCAKLKVWKGLADKWLMLTRNGPRLRDLLKACGATPPLRALNGHAFAGDGRELAVIKLLCNIPSSQLAPLIPKGTAPRIQSHWLSALSEWTSIMQRRLGRQNLLFDWAASAIGSRLADDASGLFEDPDFWSVEICCLNIHEVADYVVAGNPLNPRWRWWRARDEALAWHKRIRSDETGFERAHGVGWRELIDYRGLPDVAEVGGFTITALRSGSALFDEGEAIRHCVASYARDIIGGNCFIYSVRCSRTPMATFELRFTEPMSPLRYKLIQMKGPCNSVVSSAVRETVDRFVDRINATPPRPRLP
jgi:hypothetical protein